MGRKPVSKVRRLSPKHREKYLKLLLPIFQEYGLNHHTMMELTYMLGISKATFYQYFASKEEMISSMLSYILSNIREFEPVLKNNTLSFRDRYFQAIMILTENVSGISNSLISDLKGGYPQHWQMVEQFTTYSTGILRSFYEEGISAGAFNKLDSRILALSDQIFINTIADPHQLKTLGITLAEALDAYFKIKFYGLLTRSEPS